ncbi:hypothetical protein KBI33_02575 [Candidatus Shapirobacteria bacterium]|nr:hypothetical protein [Candidatus Shapirobacteria bacterium]
MKEKSNFLFFRRFLYGPRLITREGDPSFFRTIILLLLFFLLSKKNLGYIDSIVLAAQEILPKPSVYPTPIIFYGDSNYHDSLGARNPYALFDNNTYYLYYDCIEDLINSSFESNLLANGWGGWNASVSSTTEKALFGIRSLKVVTNGTEGAGAFSGDYFYNYVEGGPNSQENLAIPRGLGVKNNERYFASAYFLADDNVKVKLLVQQYRDDPQFYFENKIINKDRMVVKEGNGKWQQIWIDFIADANARDITISLVSDQKAIVYWDGVSLERKTKDEQIAPSPYVEKDFHNWLLEELIGWRTCVAISGDGVNFVKKGLIKSLGVKGAWENFERPGWVGSSFSYLNVFKYQQKWYAFVWEAGHPANLDKGQPNKRRPGYRDLRAQLENGEPLRSGFAKADSPLGPFTRLSQGGPVIDLPAESLAKCNDGKERTREYPYGCDYLAPMGAPQFINNKWVVFLTGQTHRFRSLWEGTGGNGCGNACSVDAKNGWFAINAGLALADSPLGPWKVRKKPIFNPEENLSIAKVAEGASYFYHEQSGWHIIFFNSIGGGAHAIRAAWTDKPLVSEEPIEYWPLKEQSQEIINWDQIPWSLGQRGLINLPAPVVDPRRPNYLRVYFGARKDQFPKENNFMENYYSFLFHDIGLLTLDLSQPVRSSKIIDQQEISSSPAVVKYVAEFYNQRGVSEINRVQLIIDDHVDWRRSPNRLRVMYCFADYQDSSASFKKDYFYLYNDKFPANVNGRWGEGEKLGKTLSNDYVDVNLEKVEIVNFQTVRVTWKVTFKPAFGEGEYGNFLWLIDHRGNQDYATLPREEVYAYNTNFIFIKSGKTSLPFNSQKGLFKAQGEWAPCPNGNLGNLNCDPDGLINAGDLAIILSSLSSLEMMPTPRPGHYSADIVPDGRVDNKDLEKLLKNWRVEKETYNN